jgi:hypothetical protein
MWRNQNMKFATFIHNDDAKCFHMAIQGTNKLVVMGYINFKDHMLIKTIGRWKNECDMQDVQKMKKMG